MATAGLFLIRFLHSAMEAALPTRPAASTQNGEVTWTSMSLSAFWAPGLEILTSILAPFSGVDGRVVHKDFDVCTEAGPSRKVRNFVSQSVVSRGEGVSAWACRSVFAFLVKGNSALGAVALLVFASIAVIAHGSAQPHPGRMLESRVVHNRCVGGRELEESGSAGPAGTVKSDPVSAVGADVVTQVAGGFVDAGECEGALRGCCGSESCQVVGVFASFSPDGLELGQG